MSGLSRWQDSLVNAIDTGVDDDISAAAHAAPGTLSVAAGCAVYRASSRDAREQALLDIYPVCQRILGDQAFDGLAREFVRRTPSTFADLNRFGAGFAEFVDGVVAEYPAFSGLPWLADLVALEWACQRVYCAPEASPIDLGLFERHSPAELLIRPAAALAWLHVTWSVHEIWAAHLADEPPAMQVVSGEWYLVVMRDAVSVRVQCVERAVWALLDACAKGRDIADIAEDSALDGSLLGEFVARGWIGRMEHKQSVV